ncbi:hypothetical protein ACOTWR_06295 [Aliarcobacter butzleri]|uniref:hypothetical protein n=1 Tax=Aliarcobacter butzleri TaxID=28197 RepID=UPI0021B1E4C1|nr:hypothetical protein [Aliarcobacter butzleri]MCT7563186.1 hypothetical protein [Aliarcobacter butzleri]MCT7578661.1 hypothetical protein [Aliarcobacter butzleri]MCT7647603.1 hypothetical protein [Aliarcobacter butzleri]
MLEKKSKLSISQKRDKAIYLALPKNNKIKELLKSKQLTYGDIKSAMPALIIGASFDRKHVQNILSMALMLSTIKREIDKIGREQARRYISRLRCSGNQRSYFENRMIFGWSQEKQDKAEGTEVMNIFKEYDANFNKREPYYSAGVNLKGLIRKIKDNKSMYLNICEEVSAKLQAEGKKEVLENFKKSVFRAQSNIERMDDLAEIIIRGDKRVYLPALIKKKQKNDSFRDMHEDS